MAHRHKIAWEHKAAREREAAKKGVLRIDFLRVGWTRRPQTRTHNTTIDLGLFGGVSDQPPLVAGGSYITVVSFPTCLSFFLSLFFFSSLLHSFHQPPLSLPSHLIFFPTHPPHSSPFIPHHPILLHITPSTSSLPFTLSDLSLPHHIIHS